MKKLFALLFMIGMVSLAQAQQTNSTSNTAASSNCTMDTKCHGVTKECPTPCMSSKNTESMSSSYSNAGASANQGGKKKNKEKCSASASCGETQGTKSCCQGASKAKAINTTPAEPSPNK